MGRKCRKGEEDRKKGQGERENWGECLHTKVIAFWD